MNPELGQLATRAERAEDAISQVYGYASRCAIAARATDDFAGERRWLDLLHMLDAWA